MEPRLLDARGSHSQVRVVRDRLDDRRSQLIVLKCRQPIVGHHARASASGRPRGRHRNRRERLGRERGGVGRVLQHASRRDRRGDRDTGEATPNRRAADR